MKKQNQLQQTKEPAKQISKPAALTDRLLQTIEAQKVTITGHEQLIAIPKENIGLYQRQLALQEIIFGKLFDYVAQLRGELRMDS
jgi:hypothetical protein